jgi:hypothetical protein
MSDDNVVDFEKYRVSVGRGTAPEISALDLQRYREWMQSRAMKKYMLYERQKPTFCEFLIADDLTCRVLLGDTSQARARFNVQIQKGKAALRRARPRDEDDKLLRRFIDGERDWAPAGAYLTIELPP